jgi:hypothetical protein
MPLQKLLTVTSSGPLHSRKRTCLSLWLHIQRGVEASFKRSATVDKGPYRRKEGACVALREVRWTVALVAATDSRRQAGPA